MAAVSGKLSVTAFDALLPAVRAIDQGGRCFVAPGIPRAHLLATLSGTQSHRSFLALG